jgi:hypothetical protein
MKCPDALIATICLTGVACSSAPNLPAPSSRAVQQTGASPGVAWILVYPEGPAIFFCTGVFIAPRAVLTASWCLDRAPGLTVGTPNGDIDALQYVIDDDVSLAVAQLPSDGVNTADVLPLGSSVSVGTTATVIGFDGDGDAADFQKLSGTNVIADRASGYLGTETPLPVAGSSGVSCPENRAGICLGQAAVGSALLTGPDLVGILAGTSTSPPAGEQESLFVDLTTDSARAFIHQVNKDLNLGIAGF